MAGRIRDQQRASHLFQKGILLLSRSSASFSPSTTARMFCLCSSKSSSSVRNSLSHSTTSSFRRLAGPAPARNYLRYYSQSRFAYSNGGESFGPVRCHIATPQPPLVILCQSSKSGTASTLPPTKITLCAPPGPVGSFSGNSRKATLDHRFPFMSNQTPSRSEKTHHSSVQCMLIHYSPLGGWPRRLLFIPAFLRCDLNQPDQVAAAFSLSPHHGEDPR